MTGWSYAFVDVVVKPYEIMTYVWLLWGAGHRKILFWTREHFLASNSNHQRLDNEPFCLYRFIYTVQLVQLVTFTHLSSFFVSLKTSLKNETLSVTALASHSSTCWWREKFIIKLWWKFYPSLCDGKEFHGYDSVKNVMRILPLFTIKVEKYFPYVRTMPNFFFSII